MQQRIDFANALAVLVRLGEAIVTLCKAIVELSKEAAAFCMLLYLMAVQARELWRGR